MPFHTTASASIEVETDETDPELILDAAYAEGVPGICASCSGWGRKHSLEVGDDWETDEKEDGSPVIYNEDGSDYVEGQ